MDRRIFRGSEERNEGENERKNLRRYFVMQTTKERGEGTRSRRDHATVEIALYDNVGEGQKLTDFELHKYVLSIYSCRQFPVGPPRHRHGFHAPSGKKSARLSTVPFKSLIPSFVTNVTLTLMLHASCNLGRVST